MKVKTFLLTLLLFLLFFNGGILLMSVSSLRTNLEGVRERSLGEHYFIAASWRKDLVALESRGITRAAGLSSLLPAYADYYQKDGVYLCLTQGGQVLYSGLPGGAPPPEAAGRAAGDRVVRTDRVGTAAFTAVYGAMPAPYQAYTLAYYYDLSPLLTAWHRTTGRLFLAGALLSALLAACLLLLLQRLFRPLAQISASARRIAQGDYAGRLPVHGHDEVAALAENFNHMAREVEGQIAALEEAARQKQRFADSLAHELRTPLTSIYGYAELIQKAALSEEDRLTAAGYIMAESRRLQQISARLLDMALLRGGALQRQPVALGPLLHKALDLLGQRAQAVQVTLAARGEATVQGDPVLLESLVVNLAENALKACAAGGRVLLEAGAGPSGPFLRVTDDGRGMTPQQLAHITEAFYRADAHRSRAEGGAGLGLALCEQIVGLHGGTLSFSSRPGQGTKATATFTTP